MNQYPERPLMFSVEVESILHRTADEKNLDALDVRARYRYAVTASGFAPREAAQYAVSDNYIPIYELPEVPSFTTILPEEEYSSPEHALFSLAEYSGLGHEIVPALRATWLRAVSEGDDPFARVTDLATSTYESPDADLLPYQTER